MSKPESFPGIDKTTTGYRVYVRTPWPGYPSGRLHTRRFSRSATAAEMQQWQEARRVEARARSTEKAAAVAVPVGSGFIADADRYLETVQTMPQYQERCRHIRLWAALFGERPSTSIEPWEIRAQRERWLTVGPRRQAVYTKDQPTKWIDVAKPLGPQEVNLRLRALENLWTTLWPGKPNPVREVPECDTPPPQPRGQSFAICYEILDHMPDVTSPKKGEVAEAGSLSRVRFEAMFMTGLTHSQIGRLKPSDVDRTVPSVTPSRRLKGRAQGRRQRPRKAPKARRLLASALPVLDKLFALGGNKPFSRQSLKRTVRRALTAANLERAAKKLPRIDPKLRVLDLTRHTFGTEVQRLSRDLKTTQGLMGHSSIEQTAIYAAAAISEQTIATVKALDQLARDIGRRVTRETISK
jgi:integrase